MRQENCGTERHGPEVDPALGPFPSAFWEAPAAEDAALLTYLRAVRAHWLVFLAVVLACTSAAWLWTDARPPTYEAAARVLVAPLSASDPTFIGVQVVRESSGDPTRSVQTASALLDSGGAAQATSDLLGGDPTALEVADAVTVEPVGGSNVLAVRARAGTAEEAAAIATSYARSALALRNDAVRAQIAAVLNVLEEQRGASTAPDADLLSARIVNLRAAQAQGDPSLSLEQEAAPGRPTGVPRSLVLVLSVIAGSALAGTAAVLLELGRRRVRDTEEASALFPLPVIARVPRLFVWRRQPTGDGALHLDAAAHEAFQRVYRELAHDPRSGSTIMFTSASAGDGKTTAAVYLAATMALAGRRVVLLDCDLRNPGAARMLGLGRRDWTGAEVPADVRQLLVHVPGLPLSFLSFSERGLPSGATEALIDRLPDVLAQVRPVADFVVIDTAPLGEVSDALPLLRVVDHVVVVTRPGHTDRGSFEAMRDLLRRMKAPVYGLLVFGGARAHGRTYARGRGTSTGLEPSGDAHEAGRAAGGRPATSASRGASIRSAGRPDAHRVRTGRGH